MEIIFQQRILKIDNTTTENIIGKINELLDESYYFSHFLADGIEVLESHEDYLVKNKHEI